MTGSKILRILKVAGLAPELPEDLYHLIKKVITTTDTRMHVHSQLRSMVSTAAYCSDLGHGNTVAHSQRGHGISPPGPAAGSNAGDMPSHSRLQSHPHRRAALPAVDGCVLLPSLLTGAVTDAKPQRRDVGRAHADDPPATSFPSCIGGLMTAECTGAWLVEWSGPWTDDR